MRTRVAGVMRRFSAEHVGGGKIKYTCRTCGKVTYGGKIGPRGHKRYMDVAMAEKLAKYQNQGGGATGRCAACAKGANL